MELGTKTLIALILGGLMLFGGISMPETETTTSRSCVDSTYPGADGCVESTFQYENYGKESATGIGFILLLAGGISAYNQTKSNDNSRSRKVPTQDQRTSPGSDKSELTSASQKDIGNPSTSLTQKGARRVDEEHTIADTTMLYEEIQSRLED